MGTRSAIGIEYEDGTIMAVYCHWDGYISHNGAILNAHYDRAKTEQLISEGDLSSLGANIGTRHNFNDRVEGECTFYGRDRGEVGIDARKFYSPNDFFLTFDSGAEYWYLLRGDTWFVRTRRAKDWYELEQALTNEPEVA